MPVPEVLLTGLAFGESPRWHDGRLWVSDWGAQEIIAVDPASGASEVAVRVSFRSVPMCIDWLPGNRGLLIVSPADARVLRRDASGELVPYADLSALGRIWNEIVVDGRGNAYVNGGGSDLMAGEEFRPGVIALVTPDGRARQVADGIAFGNGMAVTPDNATLIVAESYGSRLTAFGIAADGSLSGRRVWAGVDGYPDGICLDATGAVWFADVPARHCVRVAEGGEVLDTVGLDRGCFACMLGGPGRQTLFLVATEWHGPEHLGEGPRTGQVLAVPAPAPAAGWP